MNKYIVLSILSMVLFLSCTNNSPDDLIEVTINVKYNSEIKNIIEANCLNCHSNPPTNGAPMQLTSYEAVKIAVQNRGLIDRISREQGSGGMMPLGGTRLPQSSIDQIIEWQTNGFPE